MIEKFLHVEELTDKGICLRYLKYNPTQYVCEDVFMENGIPQPEDPIPVIRVMMDAKAYVEDNLKDDITDKFEKEIINKLLYFGDTVEGKEQDLPYLIAKGDMEIYDATKRFRANIIVTNPKNKHKLSKEKREFIYTDLVPENNYIMVVKADDMLSYPVAVIKNKEKYLLEFINPELLKIIVTKE